MTVWMEKVVQNREMSEKKCKNIWWLTPYKTAASTEVLDFQDVLVSHL